MNNSPLPVSHLVAEDLRDAWEGYPKDCAETWSPVLTKQDFVRRYALGEFGNRSPTWNTLEDYVTSNTSGGLFHLRNRVAGGDTYYNLTEQELIAKWASMPNPSSFYCSAMAPTEKTILQGEVMLSPTGWQLCCTTVKKPMREALAESSEHHTGVIAMMILDYYLCPNSQQWLRTLLDRYPGHVVEFSTFSVCWGTLPNYNSVWWEIRNY